VPCINTIVNKVYIWYNLILYYITKYSQSIYVLICLIVCNYEFLEDAYVDQRILKTRAKKVLKVSYWKAFVVSLILGIAIGDRGGGSGRVLTI